MDDTRDMITPGSATHWAALEQRVTGIERGIKDIVGVVQNLANKVDQSQKTPWAVIWTAMGVCATVLGLIGTLAYYPINSNLARLELQSMALQTEMVPRREIEVRRQVTDAELAAINKRLDRLEYRNWKAE